MTIETKYDLGQEVFTMFSDKIVRATINGIKVIKSNNMCSWGNILQYNLQMIGGGYLDREDKLFKTKEELLASL